MKRIIYPFFAALFVLAFSAEVTAQLNWQHFGPDGIGSKTRSIIFDADGNLLAGSSGGGVWKSVNEGLSWSKLQSYQGNPTVTGMIRNGNTIYVATGETSFLPYELVDQPSLSYNPQSATGAFGYMGLPGSGIYVSTNNGQDWSNDNATTRDFPTLQFDGPFVSVQKLALGEGGRLFVATRQGLFYSDDQLSSITQAEGSETFKEETVYDVEVSGNVVLAGTQDSLYISKDGGANFTAVLDDDLFINGRLSFIRMNIEVASANPDIIYVAGTRNSSNNQLGGIWVSKDRGDSWEPFAPRGGPGFSPLGNTVTGRLYLCKVKPGTTEGLIIAGQNWYTYTNEDGWQQTAQHSNPNVLAKNYLPNPIYTITFNPDDPNSLYIGTGSRIYRSDDLGKSFYQRTKGFGSAVTYSVTSVGLEGSESIISGTPDNGTILNNTWWREPYDQADNPSGPPTLKGFGTINSATNGQVKASYTYPGSIIIQGSDGGVLRSDGSFGATFERFYGAPLNADEFGRLMPLNGIDTSLTWFVDRSGRTSEPGGLVDNGKLAPQTPFVLDEVVPERMVGNPGDDINALPGRDSLQALRHYVFLAASRFVYVCHFALGDTSGLLPRWDRITNNLLRPDEYYTAIAVSGDDNHTVYVGSSQGRLFRIKGSTDFETFDASRTEFVAELTANVQPPFSIMQGRWISSIAVDPANPDRLALTYAGYGGAAPVSYVWLVSSASTTPTYAYFTQAPREPMYSATFVEKPDGSGVTLFVGSESGLYSIDNPTANPPAPVVAGAWTAQLPADFGNVPVYDIEVRRYRSVLRDEDTQDFVLYRDNTLFIASHGYGIWATRDLRFSREGEETEAPIQVAGPNAYFYPNPASSQAKLSVEMPEAARVEARLFTLDGRLVNVYANQQLEAGRSTFDISTARLNPGVYLMKVKASGETETLDKTIKVVISD
jgi:hypothetical protein